MSQNSLLCLPRPSSGQDPQAATTIQVAVPTSVPSNSILIQVDRFGFSANNVSYQALGEHPHFRYFEFHSPPSVVNNNDRDNVSVSPKTHGLVPVWGFGTVVLSNHPKIKAGERVYGYFAPVKYLVVPVSETDVNEHAFYVPRPHLPADRRPYNQITRCAKDPLYSKQDEDMAMLYRPLFWTSYWYEDWMFSTGYRGADVVLISSASSKTAFCTAYRTRIRRQQGEIPGSVKIVGLTSKPNLAFTKGLGLYDVVLSYDEGFDTVSSSSSSKVWYTDVAGNRKLNLDLFAHFEKADTPTLVAAIQLGMTTVTAQQGSSTPSWKTNNFDAKKGGGRGKTVEMEQFFMVEWLNVRKDQLTLEQIFQGQLEAWQKLMKDGKNWVKIERLYGSEKVKAAYRDVALNGLGPERGFIWSLWESSESVAAVAAAATASISKL